MALEQTKTRALVSARIRDLLFLPNTHCCNPFRKLVSIYLIICEPSKRHSQTPDLIPDRHTEQALGSVGQNVAPPIVNELLKDKSGCNIPTDSQHANRTQSIRDLEELSSKGKEKAIPSLFSQNHAHEDNHPKTQDPTLDHVSREE